MTPPTYLLAKFIPDLKRMEPRNIGVILWTARGVAARFLFEKPKNPGEVDGRTIPDWIINSNAYKQWIAYWRASIGRTQYQPPGGEAVSLTSPEFLKAIQFANQGNYVLAEAGTLLDDVPEDEIEGACQYLFDLLVGDHRADVPREPTLDDRWEAILDQAGLKGNPLLQHDYPVTSGTETFIFSDALANGVPKRLYERVAFANRPITFMKNAHHAAWQFERIIQAGIVPSEATAAVLSMNDEQEHEHRGFLASLRSTAPVINLQRPAEVSAAIQAIEKTVQKDQELHGRSESEVRPASGK